MLASIPICKGIFSLHYDFLSFPHFEKHTCNVLTCLKNKDYSSSGPFYSTTIELIVCLHGTSLHLPEMQPLHSLIWLTNTCLAV